LAPPLAKLMAYLITMGSREGDIVLEPFSGSGTTCIAAMMLNRNFIGIEISPEYHEIALKRLEHYRRQMAAA
jgi:site-specific DNA-methyltransferase (adenine-specific)